MAPVNSGTQYIQINDQKIKCGEHKEIRLTLAHIPSGEALTLPTHVFNGKKEGPVLLLTGGIHGDEANGVEIVRRLVANKLVMPEAGGVIAVPLVNPIGFMQHERHMPGGKDINRSFPGRKNGSLAGFIAYTLMNKILPLIDYAVDFHAGGHAHANFPQIRCAFENDKNRELAQAFSPPVIVNSSLIEHSYRKTAQKKGKPILVFESGEANRFYREGIQEGVNGTLRLMKYLGLLTKAPEDNSPNIYKKSMWIRANSAGIFHPASLLGTHVSAGEQLGFISDPYGNESVEVQSPQDAQIIGLNKAPVVYKGDALIHLAYNED